MPEKKGELVSVKEPSPPVTNMSMLLFRISAFVYAGDRERERET